MRDNDGRKLDHKTLEVLRLRAVDQVNAGARPAEVAAALGLSRSVLYRWLAAYRDGGQGALLAKPVPGRPPRLSALQVRRLWGLIVGSDPRQLQFDFALWTRGMVRELIRREFGVGLSVVSVGRLLARMGLSPQRPLYRAYQQDPEAVTRWKEQEYPAIAARAREQGATVWFCDEAGIRSDHHAGTTWAPVGQTPVVKVTGARFSVNMISAVSAKGALRFAVFDGTTTAASFIAFCKRLVHDAPGPVFLVVDGHPAHRARAVKAYVASTAGRLELFTLPGYSPELNPDEWVWKNVKNDRIARAGVTSKDGLKAKAIGALRRLQKLPRLVAAFFSDPNLRYITAAETV
ncbi:MAG: IS630 family transposase [Streptosporangiaceae bacterium]